jgi:hypothetical protein
MPPNNASKKPKKPPNKPNFKISRTQILISDKWPQVLENQARTERQQLKLINK